jgi:SWI/SNF-related matrix-associated actin-dependent regulator 1 of chromatin subfamily A
MTVIVNKIDKNCSNPSCNKQVRIGEGFAQKTETGWRTWCKDCCPERIAPQQARQAPRRVLTALGQVITPYEPDNLALVRSFPGATFHNGAYKGKCKCKCGQTHQEAFWQVSLDQCDRERVLAIADQLGLAVDGSLRQVVLTEQAQNAKHAGLYEFQVFGVNWLSKQQYALLGDEMGLGKTIQSLVALPEKARALVVCPNGLKYNWRDEAAKWRPDYTVTVINAGDKFHAPAKGEIVIVNYENVPDFLYPPKPPVARPKSNADYEANRRVLDLFRSQLRLTQPELAECKVIVDEAHKVKGIDTDRGLKVRELAHLCAGLWGLTGTPLLNKAMDLWGVLVNLGLEDRAFGDAQGKWAWANFKRGFNARKEFVRGARREVLIWGHPTPEVPEKLRRVMLQRKRAEVLPDLPKKVYTDLLVDLNAVKGASAIKKELDSLWEEWEGFFGVKEKLPPFTDFSGVLEKLARGLVDPMLEYVDNCEEQDVPLVVASAHLAPLDALLGRDGWAVITGETPPEQRQEIVKAFQAGRLKGVGCSITAAGVGLTLTHASKMLFVDLDWVPANNWQMEDRICRIGQTANKCEIVRMVTDHVLVRHMHKLIAKKIALIAAAIDGKAEANVPVAVANAAPVQGETEAEFQARMKRVEELQAEWERKQAEEEALHARANAQVKAKEVREREAMRASGSTRTLLPLTEERIEAVRRAFKYMLSVCDGAHQRDAQGFNKPDAVVAHCILPCGLEQKEEIEAAYWMLSRYHRQLSGLEPLLFSEAKKPGKRLLGTGKARDFTVGSNEVLVEEGTQVYAVPAEGYFCTCCEGSGCRSCKFSGLEADRKKRKAKAK